MLFFRKYDLGIVKQLQEEGKIPKFRIVETRGAISESTFLVEVRLAEDLSIKPIRLFRDKSFYSNLYPTIGANTWIFLSVYMTYKTGRDHLAKVYRTKRSAQKAIDETILSLLKEVKLSTTYTDYP